MYFDDLQNGRFLGIRLIRRPAGRVVDLNTIMLDAMLPSFVF